MFLALLGIEILLVAVFMTGALMEHTSGLPVKWLTSFDLAGEANVPSWFSSTQLLCIAVMAFLLSFSGSPSETPSSRFFAFVGFAFLYLSLDEAAMIHERMNTLLVRVDAMPTFPSDNGAWIFLYAAAALGVALLCHRDALALWRNHSSAFLLFAAGCTAYVSGAVCIEISAYHSHPEQGVDLAFRLKVAAEEFLEMLGVSLILCGTLQLLLARARRQDIAT